MAKQRRQRKIGLVAFAAAVLIALQAVFSSFALAATVGMPTVDAFGNTLCVNSVDRDDPASAPGKDRSLPPDCCMSACGMAIGFLPAGKAGAILFNPLAQPSQRITCEHAEHVRQPHDDISGHPRAPPATA